MTSLKFSRLCIFAVRFYNYVQENWMESYSIGTYRFSSFRTRELICKPGTPDKASLTLTIVKLTNTLFWLRHNEQAIQRNLTLNGLKAMAKTISVITR